MDLFWERKSYSFNLFITQFYRDVLHRGKIAKYNLCRLRMYNINKEIIQRHSLPLATVTMTFVYNFLTGCLAHNKYPVKILNENIHKLHNQKSMLNVYVLQRKKNKDMWIGAKIYYAEKKTHIDIIDNICLGAKWQNAFQVEIISECWKMAKHFQSCLCPPVRFHPKLLLQ